MSFIMVSHHRKVEAFIANITLEHLSKQNTHTKKKNTSKNNKKTRKKNLFSDIVMAPSSSSYSSSPFGVCLQTRNGRLHVRKRAFGD
jgi:hypothetical protein